MSGSLYKNVDKKRVLAEQAAKKLESLSIGYDPINAVKSDLRHSTVLEKEAESIHRENIEINALSKKYGGRVIDRKDLAHYILSSNMVLREVSHYKADLSKEVLTAIKDFADKNGIDLRMYSSNFKILAPRKYFNEKNRKVDNVKHNVYYLPVENGGWDTGKFVEVYGSDFEYGFFAPIVEAFSVETYTESNIVPGLSILFTIFNVIMFAAFIATGFEVLSIGIMSFYLIVNVVLLIVITVFYNGIFKSKEYLNDINIKDVLREGKGKI